MGRQGVDRRTVESYVEITAVPTALSKWTSCGRWCNVTPRTCIVALGWPTRIQLVEGSGNMATVVRSGFGFRVKVRLSKRFRTFTKGYLSQ